MEIAIYLKELDALLGSKPEVEPTSFCASSGAVTSDRPKIARKRDVAPHANDEIQVPIFLTFTETSK